MPGITREPILKINTRGPRVCRLQEILRQLGYSINDDAEFFGADTRDAVMDFQSNNKLRPTGIANQKTLAAMRLSLVGGNDNNSECNAEGTISGKLTKADGVVVHAKVEAYDICVNSKTLLSSAKTKKDGTFKLIYDLKDNYKPDVQVCAVIRNKKLARSKVYFNASNQLTVNLIVDDKEYVGPSMYQKLNDAILPLCENEGVVQRPKLTP